MRLGVLRNPASTGNRGRPAPALPPGAVLVETAGPAGAAEALRRLREAGAELVVVDGGDGTVRDALGAFPAVHGKDWPPLAILAHGNTNLVARRLGRVRPRDLARIAAAEPGSLAPMLRSAPVLRLDLEAEGAAAGTRRGFIAGWGAYAAGTRIGSGEIAARHGAQVAGALLATLWRTLAGRAEGGGPPLRAGVACALAADGHPVADGRRFLGIATSLAGRLVGPLRPFWGEGAGEIRWLDVLAPPRRLALAAGPVALGRPAGWMRRAGYRSGLTPRLRLTLGPESGGIVLDGEVFGRGAALGVTLTAEERVRIVDPALGAAGPRPA